MPGWLFGVTFPLSFGLIVIYLVLGFWVEFRLRPLRRKPEGQDIPELFSPFDYGRTLGFLYFSDRYKSVPDPMVRRAIPAMRVLILLILPLWLISFVGSWIGIR